MLFALINKKHLYPTDNIVILIKAEIYFDQTNLLWDFNFCKSSGSFTTSMVLISFDNDKLYQVSNMSYSYYININDINIVDINKFDSLMSLI